MRTPPCACCGCFARAAFLRSPLPPPARPAHLTPCLRRRRSATFWETTSSGRPVVWSNLRVAAEAMINGDYELASTVLDAADIRVPHADLTLAYDALGARYEVPRHVYSNPTNILSDEEFQRLSSGGGLNAGGKGSRGVGGGGGGGGGAPREFGGPQVELPLTLRICATQASNEQDVRLAARSGDSVGGVKLSLHAHLCAGGADQAPDASVPRPNVWSRGGLPPARQRLMFRGRELGDDVFLWDAGLRPDGATLQVFVRPE